MEYEAEALYALALDLIATADDDRRLVDAGYGEDTSSQFELDCHQLAERARTIRDRVDAGAAGRGG